MGLTLYSLPAGTRVEETGSWADGDGNTGVLEDVDAARDILEFNVNASSFSAARRPGVTVRWRIPVRVYIQGQ
jgi:hypothetical protein